MFDFELKEWLDDWVDILEARKAHLDAETAKPTKSHGTPRHRRRARG